jgi:cell division protein FtsA
VRGKSEIVGAVDFGSRDVRVLIARKDGDGTIQVIGHGAAAGHGCVSQGVIQDLSAVQACLREALREAEAEARLKVMTLFCGINGRNVETFVREGSVELENDIVEQHHMDDALELASQDISEVGQRVVSSLIAQEWYVDDLRVLDPVSITGKQLKTRVHFARIPAVIEDNIALCVESQRRDLEDVVFMPLAAALGCLTPEDRELGVAVLDMGRMTTGLSVFRDRRILGTGTFEWGGYHLTRDVAAGLHVSFEEADELILEYGIADDTLDPEGEHEARGRMRKDSQIKLKTAVHGAPDVVHREELDVIVYERAKELMTKVRQHLQSNGFDKHLVRGIVLTGGSASIKNTVRLAETVFQVPVRIGIPLGVEIIPAEVRGPEYCGAIGLIKHGFEFRAAVRDGRLGLTGPVARRARQLSEALLRMLR